MAVRNETNVPSEVVDTIVETLLGLDSAVCECRRSPFDKHDVNPPCSTRRDMEYHVLLTLNLAAPHFHA